MHTILGTLPVPDNDSLREENPLFAASPSYAREFGGALTGRFLDALPPDFQEAPLVIDSFLVGLARCYDPGPRWFHREPFPERAGGAYDLANAEREVEHVHCVFGPSLPELLVGAIDEAALPAVSGGKGAAARACDAILSGLVASGALAIERPVEGALVRYDPATWLRWPPAEQVGFHLWIRATRGTQRPLVNGLRNTAHM